MSSHSIIAPSSANRRRACTGSAIMEAMHPDTSESEDSREGTASHELATIMVDALTRGRTGYPARDKTIGQEASNGVVWTEESYDCAEVFAEECGQLMQRTKVFGGEHFFSERKVQAPSIHPDSEGTLDFGIYDKATGIVYVKDYKFGHRPVEVMTDMQTFEYAIAIWDSIGSPKGTNFDLTIVQPRSFHRDGTIRRRWLPATEAMKELEIMKAVEAEALGDSPRTVATVPGCRNCSGRHSCDTLGMACFDLAEYAGEPVSARQTPAQVATELAILEKAVGLLSARLTGKQAEAEALIKAGHLVPGKALEPVPGRQKWSVPDAEVLAMGDALKIDLRQTAKPVTPKQAEKKDIDASVIKEYSTTPNSIKLVDAGETIASAVFGKKE